MLLYIEVIFANFRKWEEEWIVWYGSSLTSFFQFQIVAVLAKELKRSSFHTCPVYYRLAFSDPLAQPGSGLLTHSSGLKTEVGSAYFDISMLAEPLYN